MYWNNVQVFKVAIDRFATRLFSCRRYVVWGQPLTSTVHLCQVATVVNYYYIESYSRYNTEKVKN